MSHHITAAQTAVLIPIGTIIGAAASYLATRRTSKDALAAQKEENAARAQRAHDQRRWDRRADVYVQMNLVTILVETFMTARVGTGREWSSAMPEFTEAMATFNPSIAGLSAFGSDAVIEQVRPIIATLNAISSTLAEMDDETDPLDDERAEMLDGLAAQLMEAAFSARAQIRAELALRPEFDRDGDQGVAQ